MSETQVNEWLVQAAEKAYKAKEGFDKAMRTLKIEATPGYTKPYAQLVTAYSQGDTERAAALEKKVFGKDHTDLSVGEKAELLNLQADAWTKMSSLYTEKYGAKSKGNALYQIADEAGLLTAGTDGTYKLNLKAEGVMEKLERETGLSRKTLKKYNDNIRKKKTVGGEILSWVLTLASVVAIVLIVRTFLFEPIRVDGTSMTHTLPDRAIVFSSKIDYLLGDIERGDVVICHYPDRYSKMLGFLPFQEPTRFVKRVVGLPGDHVEIRRNQSGIGYSYSVYVNGVEYAYPEHCASGIIYLPYYHDVTLKSKANGDDADEYFVIGDNRASSHDCRAEDVGPITRDMITGKVRFIMWPLNEIREVKNEAVPVTPRETESTVPQQ